MTNALFSVISQTPKLMPILNLIEHFRFIITWIILCCYGFFFKDMLRRFSEHWSDPTLQHIAPNEAAILPPHSECIFYIFQRNLQNSELLWVSMGHVWYRIGSVLCLSCVVTRYFHLVCWKLLRSYHKVLSISCILIIGDVVTGSRLQGWSHLRVKF